MPQTAVGPVYFEFSLEAGHDEHRTGDCGAKGCIVDLINEFADVCESPPPTADE